MDGVTIHNILEKVDLLHFDEDSDSSPEKTSGNDDGSIKKKFSTNPTKAYLGPKLWNNSITMADLMDEDGTLSDIFQDDESPILFTLVPEPEPAASPPIIRPSIIVPAPKINKTSVVTVKIEPNLTSGANNFLYKESKRAIMEREREQRKRKLEEEIDFSPEDIALATVPGFQFDPKTRAFDMEELRPLPIIKKRRQKAVPAENKDGKYWENRQKNREATRRSREAKRLKENQIVMRAAFLEKQNKGLKQELSSTNFARNKLQVEVDILKMKLLEYETNLD